MSSHILSLLPGRSRSISKIVAPMGKILRELETYAAKQDAKAEKASSRASALNVEAEQSVAEASTARALASNYQALITPKA